MSYGKYKAFCKFLVTKNSFLVFYLEIYFCIVARLVTYSSRTSVLPKKMNKTYRKVTIGLTLLLVICM